MGNTDSISTILNDAELVKAIQGLLDMVQQDLNTLQGRFDGYGISTEMQRAYVAVGYVRKRVRDVQKDVGGLA